MIVPFPKLKEHQVDVIRKTLTAYNAETLAQRFGVTITTIRTAARGDGIYGGYNSSVAPIKWIRQRKKTGVRDEQKQEIKNLVAQKESLGLTYQKIADMFNVTAGYIHQIANEKTNEKAKKDG